MNVNVHITVISSLICEFQYLIWMFCAHHTTRSLLSNCSQLLEACDKWNFVSQSTHGSSTSVIFQQKSTCKTHRRGCGRADKKCVFLFFRAAEKNVCAQSIIHQLDKKEVDSQSRKHSKKIISILEPVRSSETRPRWDNWRRNSSF